MLIQSEDNEGEFPAVIYLCRVRKQILQSRSAQLSFSSLQKELASDEGEMSKPAEIKISYDVEWGMYSGRLPDKIRILQTEYLSHKNLRESL